MTEPIPAGSSPAPGFATAPPRDRDHDRGGIVAGVVLIAIGVMLFVGQSVPDVGQYVVLAVGVVLFALFAVRREYGVLVPACIVTGVGAGVPLAAANPGDLGGGLVLICLATGFLAIWLLGALFRLRENHWWPVVPAVVLGTIGGALVAGERGRPLADTVATLWPIVFLAIGALLIGQELVRRPR